MKHKKVLTTSMLAIALLSTSSTVLANDNILTQTHDKQLITETKQQAQAYQQALQNTKDKEQSDLRVMKNRIDTRSDFEEKNLVAINTQKQVRIDEANKAKAETQSKAEAQAKAEADKKAAQIAVQKKAEQQKQQAQTQAQQSYQAPKQTYQAPQTTYSAPQQSYQAPAQNNVSSNASISLQQFMFNGVVNFAGYKFTYYSQGV